MNAYIGNGYEAERLLEVNEELEFTPNLIEEENTVYGKHIDF